MAANNMKAIKNRIKSVEGTKQITKAMELVASSKLRRAKENAERAKPYYDRLQSAIDNVVLAADSSVSALLSPSKSEADCYVMIAGDRGLAGGYNNNLLKLAKTKINPDKDLIVPVGKKAIEHYAKYQTKKLTEEYETVASLGVADALDLGKTLCDAYKTGTVGRVFVVYTKFLSMMRQEAVIEQVLPLSRENKNQEDNAVRVNPMTIFDPDEEQIVDRIVEQYVTGIVYAAIRQAFASECAQRRSAMESATDNAEEMIQSLTLHFNRARQAAITQEITEVVSGSMS